MRSRRCLLSINGGLPVKHVARLTASKVAQHGQRPRRSSYFPKRETEARPVIDEVKSKGLSIGSFALDSNMIAVYLEWSSQ